MIKFNLILLRLVSRRQADASISHYIEAGATTKALEAAVNAKQWLKAVQVCNTDLILPYEKC